MWVNQSNEMNPQTPFTCGKEKKKLYSYAVSDSLLQNDFTQVTLNKPLLILNRGKIVISGGHWRGQISVSITQDYQKPQSQASSQMKSGQSALSDYNSSQFISAEIEAHTSTCTVISSTIDDPNKIISKHAQN